MFRVGGKRSKVEGSEERLRGAIRGGGERLEALVSNQRWRGAIRGGSKLSAIRVGEERSEEEGSDQRWKERSEVEGVGPLLSVSVFYFFL